MTDAEVVRLAKSFLSIYARSHVLMKSFEQVSSGNAVLERISGKLRMAHSIGDPDFDGFHNRNMSEFLSIIASGVGDGAQVEKPVALLVRRLEREIAIKNRIRAKVGGAQTLTYMGMGIFFPLFSGISAIIISSAVGLVDSGAAMLYRNFLIVAIAYIPIILYLSSAFAHPERTLAQNLISIMPYFLLGAGIIYATQGYLANVV